MQNGYYRNHVNRLTLLIDSIISFLLMSISLNKRFFISSWEPISLFQMKSTRRKKPNEKRADMFTMGNANHYNIMIYGCGIFFSLPSIMWYCHTGNYRHGFWLFQKIFHHGNSQGGQTSAHESEFSSSSTKNCDTDRK
jgi:hypothetical protein